MGGEKERQSEGMKVGGYKRTRWEDESDAMKPPDVNPLEAASGTTQGYNPQSTDCNVG